MQDCIFCKIINKDIESFVVLENKLFLAILDVNPCTDAHTIIIPKRHVEKITELNSKESALMFDMLDGVISLLGKKLGISNFTIGINHGKIAGQDINHLHMHIIPRYEQDGGGSIHSVVNMSKKENLASVYNKIISL